VSRHPSAGLSYVVCATCGRRLLKDEPKVSYRGGWRCSECEYDAQTGGAVAEPWPRDGEGQGGIGVIPY